MRFLSSFSSAYLESCLPATVILHLQNDHFLYSENLLALPPQYFAGSFANSSFPKGWSTNSAQLFFLGWVAKEENLRIEPHFVTGETHLAYYISGYIQWMGQIKFADATWIRPRAQFKYSIIFPNSALCQPHSHKISWEANACRCYHHSNWVNVPTSVSRFPPCQRIASTLCITLVPFEKWRIKSLCFSGKFECSLI